MPKCAICDADVDKFGDDCSACRTAISEALDDYDLETIEDIHIAGIVMPLQKAPLQDDE